MNIQSILTIKNFKPQCQPYEDGKGLVTLRTSLQNQFQSQLVWVAREHSFKMNFDNCLRFMLGWCEQVMQTTILGSNSCSAGASK